MNSKISFNIYKYVNVIDTLIENSKNSDCSYKHAAAVIKHDKILAIGINHFKGISIHAEVDAIKNYLKKYNKKRLDGLDLIVIRNSGMNLSYSKPCKYCCLFLKEKGIRNIFYSDYSGNITIENVETINNSHICCYKRNTE